MSSKILALLILISSFFTLSACNRSDSTSSPSPRPTPIPTDEEVLLQELDTGTEFSIDADLSNLEKELQQL